VIGLRLVAQDGDSSSGGRCNSEWVHFGDGGGGGVVVLLVVVVIRLLWNTPKVHPMTKVSFSLKVIERSFRV